MKKIAETKFQTLFVESSLHLLIQNWKPETASMTDDEFKKESEILVEAVRRTLGVTALLSDAREFGYTVAPHMQNWWVDRVATNLDKLGIRHCAMRPSTDLFTRLSAEQLADEVNQKDFLLKMRAVGSQEEAQAYLFGNRMVAVA